MHRNDSIVLIKTVVLELDISSSWDHHCAGCVDPPGTHSGKLMEPDTVRKILEEAAEWGVKGVVFNGGGESTLHPESASIFRMAALAGFEVGLVTNGSHFDQKGLAESIVGCLPYCTHRLKKINEIIE